MRRRCMRLVRQMNQAGGVKGEQLKMMPLVMLIYKVKLSPGDTIGHEELSTVDNEPGEVTEKKQENNTDEDAGKIHLIMSRTVVPGPHMGKPAQTWHGNDICTLLDRTYFIPLNILVLK